MNVPIEVARCTTLAELLERSMEEQGLNAHSLWVRCKAAAEDGSFVTRQQVWAWCRGDYVPSDRHRLVLFETLGWGPAVQLYAQTLIANHRSTRKSA